MFEQPPKEERTAFDQNIAYNKDRFFNEFNGDKIGKVELHIPLETLISKVKESDNDRIIENVISIEGTNYDLGIRYMNGDLRLDAIGKDGQIFNANHSGDERVAGWIAQGGYSFLANDSNKSYASNDHWGVSVTPELKGTGLSDFLYDVKSLINNQLEFEHVSGSDYKFLTFYLKKGYVPYSIVKLPELNEEILKDDDVVIMLNDVINKRISGETINEDDIDYAIKLRLDPQKAEGIYNRISKLEKF